MPLSEYEEEVVQRYERVIAALEVGEGVAGEDLRGPDDDVPHDSGAAARAVTAGLLTLAIAITEAREC